MIHPSFIFLDRQHKVAELRSDLHSRTEIRTDSKYLGSANLLLSDSHFALRQRVWPVTFGTTYAFGSTIGVSTESVLIRSHSHHRSTRKDRFCLPKYEYRDTRPSKTVCLISVGSAWLDLNFSYNPLTLVHFLVIKSRPFVNLSSVRLSLASFCWRLNWWNVEK